MFVVADFFGSSFLPKNLQDAQMAAVAEVVVVAVVVDLGETVQIGLATAIGVTTAGTLLLLSIPAMIIVVILVLIRESFIPHPRE